MFSSICNKEINIGDFLLASLDDKGLSKWEQILFKELPKGYIKSRLYKSVSSRKSAHSCKFVQEYVSKSKGGRRGEFKTSILHPLKHTSTYYLHVGVRFTASLLCPTFPCNEQFP